MKLKTLVVVVAVLAVLSIAVYVMNRPAEVPAADARVGQSVLDAAAIDKAAKVRISDQGKSVLLSKRSDGVWVVNSYHDLPADFQKLASLIDDLAKAKVERLVTSRPERLARLEFKDSHVSLLDAADKATWTLIIGKNTESGAGKFVKFGDEAKAFQSNLNLWLDAEAKNWADAKLIEVKSEEVARVELSFPDGATLVAQRAKKEDPFTAEAPPPGQKLKADRITSLLSSVGTLRFSETSDLNDPAAAAAKANARTVKLTTFDKKTVAINFGRKPEEKIVKTPTPGDGKTGPAALGTVADLKKSEEAAPAKVVEPATETIPAGPVFATINHSDPSAAINALMQKRAFQVGEYVFSGLPAKKDELFEAEAPAASSIPAPAPAAPAAPVPPLKSDEAAKTN